MRKVLRLSTCLFLVLAVTTAKAQRIVFGTSTTGNANLGTWADAGGETGTAAGDAICQARADAAGFANPENFVAWISDSSDDAYCRLHGLTGTVAENCGQETLPASAGPWVRADGFPFGEDIEQLLSPNGVVYVPVRFDEFANPLPEAPFLAPPVGDVFLTGSSRTGELQGGSCDDWLDTPSESVKFSGPDLTTDGWSSAGTVSCSREGRLLCFERDSGPALPDVRAEGRLAFVTSVSGNGELASWPAADANTEGVEAGDSICQNLATQAGFFRPDSFRAWLSDSTTDAISRIREDGPWVRSDGILLASSRADLSDGYLNTSLSVTETGRYLGNFGSWTGTTDLGVAHPDSCSDWTDGTEASNGRNGRVYSAGFGWSGGRPEVGAPGGSPARCDTSAFRLYCLSDLPVSILTDNFELPPE